MDGPKKVVEFVPDYTVKVLTDVTYFRLKYTAYKSAKLASEIERTYKDTANGSVNSNWEAEIEKVNVYFLYILLYESKN